MALPSSSEAKKAQPKPKYLPDIIDVSDDLYDPNSSTPKCIRPSIFPVTASVPTLMEFEIRMLKQMVDTLAKAHCFGLFLKRDVAAADITDEELQAHLKRQIYNKV